MILLAKMLPYLIPGSTRSMLSLQFFSTIQFERSIVIKVKCLRSEQSNLKKDVYTLFEYKVNHNPNRIRCLVSQCTRPIVKDLLNLEC